MLRKRAEPHRRRLSELNPAGSLTISAAARLGLGVSVRPIGTLKFGAAARNTEYVFECSTTTGQMRRGLVEIIGSSATINHARRHSLRIFERRDSGGLEAWFGMAAGDVQFAISGCHPPPITVYNYR